ncbi:hypothetical protein HispidOSU_007456, partial [Sigmodon hispidus]
NSPEDWSSSVWMSFISLIVYDNCIEVISLKISPYSDLFTLYLPLDLGSP